MAENRAKRRNRNKVGTAGRSVLDQIREVDSGGRIVAVVEVPLAAVEVPLDAVEVPPTARRHLRGAALPKGRATNPESRRKDLLPYHFDLRSGA